MGQPKLEKDQVGAARTRPFRLPPSISDKLDRLAAARGTSASVVVRELIQSAPEPAAKSKRNPNAA